MTFKDDNGLVSTKACPVVNFVRWRYTDSEETDIEEEKLTNICGLKGLKNKKVSLRFFLTKFRWKATQGL